MFNFFSMIFRVTLNEKFAIFFLPHQNSRTKNKFVNYAVGDSSLYF